MFARIYTSSRSRNTESTIVTIKVVILKFLKTIIIRIHIEWRTINKPFITYSRLKHRNYKQKNQHSVIPMKANPNLEDTVYLKTQSDTTIVHYHRI
jgi:hypothetical protein